MQVIEGVYQVFNVVYAGEESGGGGGWGEGGEGDMCAAMMDDVMIMGMHTNTHTQSHTQAHTC